MATRFPAVAGTFYAATKDGLVKQIRECFLHRLGPGSLPEVSEDGERRITALVSPHAGYMYSGPVAAHGYHRLASDGRPEVFVIIGPNHTGYGSPVSMVDRGVWVTPLGEAVVDEDVAKAVFKVSGIVDVDPVAHRYEHSIEVQLPFLQYLYGPSIRFVPICMGLQDLETSREVGEAVAEALEEVDGVVIASTDLTHYEPQRLAEEKDRAMIEAIVSMDEARVMQVLESKAVSACGYGPVCASIVASKRLGARIGELLSYRTSGDVTGDYSAVVGYCSVAFMRER